MSIIIPEMTRTVISKHTLTIRKTTYKYKILRNGLNRLIKIWTNNKKKFLYII